MRNKSRKLLKKINIIYVYKKQEEDIRGYIVTHGQDITYCEYLKAVNSQNHNNKINIYCNL